MSHDSVYHHIKVAQHGNIRTLLYGGGQSREQSAINIDDLRFHIFDYSMASMYVFQFCPKPKNILVIGLGGGVIPREYAHYQPEAKIDVIELDPDVPEIARKWFYFEETDNIKVIIGDGYDYLNETDKKYDIIVVDAFFTNYIPWHLMSIEFMENVKKALTPNGLAFFNTCSVRAEYPHQVCAMWKIFGESIYYLSGWINPISIMEFCLNNSDIIPVNFDLPEQYFPPLTPEKLEINDEIKNAGPIRLSDKNAV